MLLRFDRGTIVLSDPPVGLNVNGLPGVMWDPRTLECRAPAYRYADLVAHLGEKSVTIEDRVRAESRQLKLSGGPDPGCQLDSGDLGHDYRQLDLSGDLGHGYVEPVPATPNSDLELRPYQESALNAWHFAGRRGIVALPTGSGKTRLALGAIAACGASALILVPTRVLLAQWCRVAEATLRTSIGRYGDGQRKLEPVTVSTFESGYRYMAKIGNRFEMLVVDEAHHFGSGIREDALVMSIAAQRLGLTATPPRDVPAIQRLQELIGPVVYELSIGDLTGEYLAEFELATLTLPLNDFERAEYELEMARFRPICRQFFRLNPMATWSDFIRTARRSEEGKQAIESWHRARRLLAFIEAKQRTLATLLDRHREARTLVFTSDNDTAYAVARKHLIMPITCDIGRAERDAVLERFRTGELRALVSARVLNEGLDVPDAQVAIILGGGSSQREHIQRIGRLLRPAPGKRALVYELVAAQTSEVRQSQKRRKGLGQPRYPADQRPW